MNIKFNKLWALLIDNGMKKDLCSDAVLSSNSMANMGKMSMLQWK